MGWRPRVYVTSEDALKQLLPLFALLAGLTDEQLEELLKGQSDSSQSNDQSSLLKNGE